MKTTLVALFAASLVSAQQFGGVPECAVSPSFPSIFFIEHY